MNIDPQIEASFVRIIGLLGFILATVAFFLMLSGMTEYYGNDAGTMMFVAFVMCTALAFVGLMISTLAQVLMTLQSIEKLLGGEKEPKKKAEKKKAA